MSLVYGLEGIRQRSYKVWIAYPTSGDLGCGVTNLAAEIATIQYYVAHYDYELAKDVLATLFSDYSEKLGECRKDSISLTAEDGDSVDGNEVGTIVLGKNCSFSVELLNATPDNINALQASVDAQAPFYVILEEVDGRVKTWDTGEAAPDDEVVSNDTHEIIFVGVNNALTPSLTENHVGGGISTVTLSASDSVASVEQFRVILDLPYDLKNYTTTP